MTGTVKSLYTQEQIAVWLQGLLAIAWADGHFDPEEQDLITSLNELEPAPKVTLDSATTLSPQEVAAVIGQDRTMAENFLRTAVMVAIVDGVYSEPEDVLLHQYCTLLQLDETILESLRATLYPAKTATATSVASFSADADEHHYRPVLKPVQQWLDELEIHDPRLARFLCKLIPPQCPFERDVVLFGRKLVHIPPMCKLNPLYEQLVGLRFRALSYLADDCGEDVTPYC
ncbi:MULTISPECIES: Mo-dependent nitrogenase C-terminal domain-containing protein [unclassified Leptolyngbya]|uniref:Mo-dependent nitrogenase C-terminal domain-containing protein n=1 Tax=unclassified Leptolyngbya TaxID=2650499 RepID=UPI0016833A26|nr:MULTISPECIES: Mo-dependent nitrogenase C-terminal domain-containing protein [unclassified Leptolyngbya]MBD1911869.1 nitrogenase [Leptolyngbya sp. FACHB-8]MBD2156078.1 nitrogenase [Leptolyngbya sp. FACHB-16]